MTSSLNEDRHTFIDSLGRERAEVLKGRGRSHSFKAGSTLLHEGQVGDRVVLLLSGTVKVTYTTPGGREVVIGLCGSGDLLGELAVMDGRPRSNTVTALEPVEAAVIPARDFRDFVRDPEVAEVMMRMLTERLRDADRKQLEFASRDAIGRVSARLVELAQHYGRSTGSGVEITVPMSQEELAGWSACSREAVVRALRMLRERRLIETGRYRHITVLDVDALRRQAG
jgi:CRP/FNR family cyclic AMP-dependent transcriptional regulator